MTKEKGRMNLTHPTLSNTIQRLVHFIDAWQGRDSSIKSKAVLTSQRIFSRISPPCQASICIRSVLV